MRATASTGSSRSIKVDYLTRVEGEGSILVKLKGDQVQDVQLGIFEPPRLFEGFLRGRHYLEVPDIVARICGICPVAYQMCAVHALERILDITVDPAIRLLRRLLYCGEWIESHALHIFMLHAPDFLGFPDAIRMAAEHRELVELALRLKKIGNQLMIVLGGREIHPISVTVGGFHKVPTKASLRALVDDLSWARDTAIVAARTVAGLPFPDFQQDYEFVALSHPDEYPLNEGRLVSNQGLDIHVSEFGNHFMEQHVKYSNALHCRLRERGAYLVGPLARFNLNFARLPESAQQVAGECDLLPPCLNPFRGIVVRAVELLFACEEALHLIAQYEPPAVPRVEGRVRAGVGHAATEAPRGVLYHRYEIDEHGLIVNAQIVPPTAQNQKRIEDDLWHFVPQLTNLPLDQITAKCEQAVRNYDPCISCATHFVKVEREE
ncbi:MAG TPA: Ni/Fe hydrogenase subunit alpha [Bryobacteraceae bacterium]|nr:Ni/Fe hydrogenase subunit alpha [Bryobacteraceae bacterium]